MVLAGRWGAALPLGRALRVAGLVAEDPARRVELLRQAVVVLEPSAARLECAKALIDLGVAIRHAGQRREAQDLLRSGAELAELCGAEQVVRQGLDELIVAGARPRKTVFTGPGALTPSERRVAELAVAGSSNRDIAQTLFVTTKTVELHLSNVYRKLAISGRQQIGAALTAVE
jgi:ATP/maltotriose-dependent transcriptional regulator MalT